MKSHISATIDRELLGALDRYRREERRSRSQVIEMAIERLLADTSESSDRIVVSEGRFDGKFDREETYER